MIDYSQIPVKNVLCIDMKSFFASVEAVDKGLDPMQTFLAVVANKDRSGSVVLAASPQMKKTYGIKTGSRLFEIPQNNPDIHIVESRMALYVKTASKIIQLLQNFAPYEAIDVYSIDEAWLCTDGTEKIFGSCWEVARKIRDTIQKETNLPACIGIGPNKFLAKAILDIEAKQTGIAECRYEDVKDKLWPQDIGDIWGIGRRMKKNLNHIGIFTVEDLANTPVESLKKHFGVMGEQLYWHSWGIDLSPTIKAWDFAEEQKSISTGITLMSDYYAEDAEVVILELCEEIGFRLRQGLLLCKTVYLGITYSKEVKEGFGHSYTMPNFTCISKQIYEECMLLFRQYYQGCPIRKIYVGVSNLQNFDKLQLQIFDEYNQRDLKLSFALDELKNKYGKGSIFRGVSLEEKATARERAGKIGGHKK